VRRNADSNQRGAWPSSPIAMKISEQIDTNYISRLRTAFNLATPSGTGRFAD
jgi:hypothetical protein